MKTYGVSKSQRVTPQQGDIIGFQYPRGNPRKVITMAGSIWLKNGAKPRPPFGPNVAQFMKPDKSDVIWNDISVLKPSDPVIAPEALSRMHLDMRVDECIPLGHEPSS